jgi:hypothetical protein
VPADISCLARKADKNMNARKAVKRFFAYRQSARKTFKKSGSRFVIKTIKPRAVGKKSRILQIAPAITGPAGLETISGSHGFGGDSRTLQCG